MSIAIEQLTCNYLSGPLGVEIPQPSLSWKLKSDVKGQFQTAYQVLVSSSIAKLSNHVGDLWNSGKVETDQSIQIKYKGKKLTSRQKYFWKVKVWDKDNTTSLWSDIAAWEMGLLRRTDWKAKWIGAPGHRNSENPPYPAPYFRKLIFLEKPVKNGRIYVCGLGYYELYINGKKVGDEVLAPAFTRYDKRVFYQTHDVTSYFKEGENIIGVILGNGWYNCFTKVAWNFEKAPWISQPKLLFQAHVLLEDKSRELVISDSSWETAKSPIVFDGLRNGETYDARKEIKDWCLTGANDKNWVPVVVVPGPGGILHSQQHTPIRITRTLKPVSLKEVKPGIWVYDLGQNISGWVRIKIKEAKSGKKISLKYAEKVLDNGDIDQSNINSIKGSEFQTDNYITKGSSKEIWEPRFIYHGFQYIQIKGFPGTPTIENLEGRVVHTDFNKRGTFSCSNELLNKIQKCTEWSTLGNYHGIPTDCPHREKNGWTGDAHLSGEQVLFNFDPMTAYRKWMTDFRDVQRPDGQLPGIVPTGGWGFNWGNGPAWDSAAILIPWYVYIYCADTEIISEHYQSMKKYIDYLESLSEGHIVNYGLGDWAPPYGYNKLKCPVAVTDTAYYYIDTYLLSKMAEAIGKNNDAKKYISLAEKIRKAFRKKFINQKKKTVTGDCQTSVSCALYQNMINDNEKEDFLKSLIRTINATGYHIDCGILGAKYLMNVLIDFDRADVAYEIANKTDFPSWGHWIEQGATTLWEHWEGRGSRNHHMFGDISSWLYKALAGINPDPEFPGFKHFYIKPNFIKNLEWVNASHECLYGLISVEWEKNGKSVELKIKIPVNTCATIILPAIKKGKIIIDNKIISKNKNIEIIDENKRNIHFKVSSGNYDLKFKND